MPGMHDGNLNPVRKGSEDDFETPVTIRKLQQRLTADVLRSSRKVLALRAIEPRLRSCQLRASSYDRDQARFTTKAKLYADRFVSHFRPRGRRTLPGNPDSSISHPHTFEYLPGPGNRRRSGRRSTHFPACRTARIAPVVSWMKVPSAVRMGSRNTCAQPLYQDYRPAQNAITRCKWAAVHRLYWHRLRHSLRYRNYSLETRFLDTFERCVLVSLFDNFPENLCDFFNRHSTSEDSTELHSSPIERQDGELWRLGYAGGVFRNCR
jgi:hypothetical protein